MATTEKPTALKTEGETTTAMFESFLTPEEDKAEEQVNEEVEVVETPTENAPEVEEVETEDLEECDEPKAFNNIYDSFTLWCENEGISPKKYPKSEIKAELEKIQLTTTHGLVYGKKKGDNAPNGTSKYPLFNFCSKDDIED